jgi:hypothetical protein
MFRPLQILQLLTFLFALSVSVACAHANAERPKDFPPDLWVYQAAQDVHYYDLKKIGTKQVLYTVKVCYPAGEIVKALEHAMAAKGWTRLNEDFLNPGTKLNPATGEWSKFQNEKGQQVYSWNDDWQDGAKNIIRYVLTYTSPDKEDAAKMCDLKVLSLYIPQKVREQMQKESSRGK